MNIWLSLQKNVIMWLIKQNFEITILPKNMPINQSDNETLDVEFVQLFWNYNVPRNMLNIPIFWDLIKILKDEVKVIENNDFFCLIFKWDIYFQLDLSDLWHVYTNHIYVPNYTGTCNSVAVVNAVNQILKNVHKSGSYFFRFFGTKQLNN